MLRPADAYSQQTLLAHCSGPVPRNGVGAGDAEFARVCRCFCTASLWPKPEAEPFTVVGGGGGLILCARLKSRLSLVKAGMFA